VGHVAYIGEMRNAYNILVRKLKGKRSLGRPRHRWEYNIRMDVREIWWEGVTGFIWFRIGNGGGLL
jgi:hypothetical protein